MTYLKLPPPSAEIMLETIADWLAQYMSAKVTIRIDYRDGQHQISEIDHRGIKKNEQGNRTFKEVLEKREWK